MSAPYAPIWPYGVQLRTFGGEISWLEERRHYVTASDAAVICGQSSYRSLFTLFQIKLGLEAEEIDPELAYWGHIHEAAIARRYKRDTGRQVFNPGRYTLVVNAEFPWMAATLDRTTIIDGQVVPLELKTRSAYSTKQWDAGEVPQDIYLQVQHQMVCCGAHKASLAVLIGGNKFRWTDIAYDQPVCNRLISACEDFMFHVKNQDPPDVDGHESTTRTLARLHPADNGESVQLPAEALDVDDEREEVQATIKEAERRLDELNNQLKQWLADNTFGVLPGVQYSWKTQTGKLRLICAPECERFLKSAGIPFEKNGGKDMRVLRRKETAI